MIQLELFKSVNKRLKNAGRSPVTKERFIKIITVMEPRGEVIRDGIELSPPAGEENENINTDS